MALVLSAKALFPCGMLALFTRAADPLLGAALLLNAAALSLLGTVALSLGSVVLPPWCNSALPWPGDLLSGARWPRFCARKIAAVPLKAVVHSAKRVHLLDGARAMAEAVAVPLAAARRAIAVRSGRGGGGGGGRGRAPQGGGAQCRTFISWTGRRR